MSSAFILYYIYIFYAFIYILIFYILILWYDLNQISAVCEKQFLFYYCIFIAVKVLNIIKGILFHSNLSRRTIHKNMKLQFEL